MDFRNDIPRYTNPLNRIPNDLQSVLDDTDNLAQLGADSPYDTYDQFRLPKWPQEIGCIRV